MRASILAKNQAMAKEDLIRRSKNISLSEATHIEQALDLVRDMESSALFRGGNWCSTHSSAYSPLTDPKRF